jgi:hypothetical protein
MVVGRVLYAHGVLKEDVFIEKNALQLKAQVFQRPHLHQFLLKIRNRNVKKPFIVY